MIASPADAGKSPATQTQQGRFVFIGCLPGKLNFRFAQLNNTTHGGGYRQIARMGFPAPVKKAILEHAAKVENFAVFPGQRGGFCRGIFFLWPPGDA
jgi:hypothetical protein